MNTLISSFFYFYRGTNLPPPPPPVILDMHSTIHCFYTHKTCHLHVYKEKQYSFGLHLCCSHSMNTLISPFSNFIRRQIPPPPPRHPGHALDNTF